ncbi:MAG TPA: class I SAM-dependent methyltransferase [Mycobacteriales bacterium]|nr:class I SAM-dependent methyltransferase [Mycobacteriales bacterium]HVV76612.1 class I SAM-dependent methyltransferase [Mycobacteriales bacterium]
MTQWHCPVCGGSRNRLLWKVAGDATENGVDPHLFRPSADRYGETVGTVVRCIDCGHASLEQTPTAEVLAAAYGDASDPGSVDEEDGRLETASRSLACIERFRSPGTLLDIGCWTGSFVAAAAARGWTASGIEPSTWAVAQAQERGLDVRLGDLHDSGVAPGAMRCVVMCDVIEHLLDVSDAIGRMCQMLEPGGVLYLTTPDAGGALARMMGQRWWSILPMHVQYFTRSSMRQLLEHHGLRVAHVSSHPKVFTATYYAQRLGGYSDRLATAAVSVTQRLRLDRRLVAPDLHDRMQVVAIKDQESAE